MSSYILIYHCNISGKELQKVTSRSLDGSSGTGDGGSSRLDMLVMADGANARIVDQLNGQVDFLNDQLAVRYGQSVVLEYNNTIV